MQAPLPKQYLPLLGRPVILHTLERLCSYARIRGLLLGIAPGDSWWKSQCGHAASWPSFLGTYTGGDTRAQTVLNGLRALGKRAQADDWVMVHDAVRPCVRHADLESLVNAVAAGEEGGLLALPVADTVKRTNANDQVLETVPRERLWRAMTPQMFRLGMLTETLDRALADRIEITDEAAAIERLGVKPRVVACAPDNIKITHPQDLALAELFITQQSKQA